MTATTSQATAPAPLKRLIYPFPGPGSTKEAPIEIPANQYVRTWGYSAENGFYPFGLNGQWHGGIHFDESTGKHFDQRHGVRCIADGEVIAWRYDKDLLNIRFEIGNCRYASGFVLVRHRLQYPKEELKGYAGPQPPTCRFYSLYMHLAPIIQYPDEPDPEQFSYDRPKFWPSDPNRRIAGGKVKRPEWAIFPGTAEAVKTKQLEEKGTIFVRPGTDYAVAWLPKGEALTLKPGSGSRRELESVGDKSKLIIRPVAQQPQQGTSTTPPSPSTAAMTGIPACEVEDANLEKAIGLPQTGSVHIPAPIPIKAGDLIGHLGEYQGYKEVQNYHWHRPLMHMEVFAEEGFDEFVRECRLLVSFAPENKKTLLVIEEEANLNLSSNTTPVTIGRGELLTPHEKSPAEGYWVKVKLGTTEVLEQRTLGNYDKGKQMFGNKYLYAAYRDANGADPIAAKDYDPAKHGNTHTFLKVFTPNDRTAWVTRQWFNGLEPDKTKNRIYEARWEHQCSEEFPLQAKGDGGLDIQELVAATVIIDVKAEPKEYEAYAEDDEGTRWWYVKYPVGKAIKGGFASHGGIDWNKGWVCEKGIEKVYMSTRWAWPGFELFKEDTTPPAEWYQRVQTNKYSASSDMLKGLLEILDKNRDGEISLKEYRQGWDHPYLSRSMSRMLIEHDSEWGLAMSHWDQVDAHIKGSKSKEAWKEEKKRIATLRWWDEVGGKNGFPQSIKAWHIHPLALALVENFYAKPLGFSFPFSFVPRAVGNGVNNPNVVSWDRSVMGSFGWRRSNGRRRHAGCDLYATVGEPVYSVADGVVVDGSKTFTVFTAGDTQEVTIQHGNIFVRYTEMRLGSCTLSMGQEVKRGEKIGEAALMISPQGDRYQMIHIEIYTDVNTPPSRVPFRDDNDPRRPPFLRRSDLTDPTPYLDEWAKNLPQP